MGWDGLPGHSREGSPPPPENDGSYRANVSFWLAAKMATTTVVMGYGIFLQRKETIATDWGKCCEIYEFNELWVLVPGRRFF